MTGSGTLTISKTGIYTGTTTVNSGTLKNGVANALPTTTSLTVNGGTYDMAGFAQQIAGLSGTGGAVTDSGAAATLLLSSAVNNYANTYSGNLTGTTQLSVNLSGTSAVETLAGSASTNTGATTISNGTLALTNIGASSSLGTAGISIASTGILKYVGAGGASQNASNAITLTGSGATLDVSGTTSASSAATFSGGITGNTFNLNLTGSGYGIESSAIATTTGSVTKSGTGTWKLSGTNTYSGNTIINNGTIDIVADSGLGAAPGSATINKIQFGGTNGILETSGTFTLNANRGVALTNAVGTGSGTFAPDSGTTLTYNGIIKDSTTTGTGKLVLSGLGTFSLGGVNTYTGGTTINNGTLTATSASALGISNAANTILIAPLASDTAILNLNSLTSITNIAGNLNFDSSAASSTAQLNTSAAIALSNPMLLTGTQNIINVAANTTTLNGTINGSALGVGGLTLQGAGNVTLASTATIGVTNAIATLTSNAATTAINTTAIDTANNQIYNNAVTLGANAVLTSTFNGGHGNVTFGSTVNGANSLTIAAGTGTVTFGGIVGGTTALTSLNVPGQLRLMHLASRQPVRKHIIVQFQRLAQQAHHLFLQRAAQLVWQIQVTRLRLRILRLSVFQFQAAQTM